MFKHLCLFAIITLGAIVLSIPALLILHFLFKKIKGIRARIALTVVLFSVLLIAYSLVMSAINFEFFLGVSLAALFLFTITTLCTQKSLLPNKKEFL